MCSGTQAKNLLVVLSVDGLETQILAYIGHFKYLLALFGFLIIQVENYTAKTNEDD